MRTRHPGSLERLKWRNRSHKSSPVPRPCRIVQQRDCPALLAGIAAGGLCPKAWSLRQAKNSGFPPLPLRSMPAGYTGTSHPLPSRRGADWATIRSPDKQQLENGAFGFGGDFFGNGLSQKSKNPEAILTSTSGRGAYGKRTYGERLHTREERTPMAKLSRRQKQAAAKAPNWVRTVAAAKGYTKPRPVMDDADRFIASAKRSLKRKLQ